LKDVGTDDRV